MISSTDGLRLAPGDAVDLQLHTDLSDGRWTLAALLEHLRRELVAVEMTSAWEGGLVDLLCFGFDVGHEVLATVIARPSSQQPQAWVDALREAGIGDGGSSAGEPVARAGCSFATNDPAAVVEATHRCGGVCLLAHPGRADGFVPFDDERMDRFRREVPIDGLEVAYPLHSPAQTVAFQAYARRHGLLTSAGSDSHGPERPPIPYLAKSCRGLLERLGLWGV